MTSDSLLEGNPYDVARQLLAKCYERVGMPVPGWLDLLVEESMDLEEDIKEEFCEGAKEHINDSFAKYVSRVVQVDAGGSNTTPAGDVGFGNKLRILLQKDLLPGVYLRGGDDGKEYVWITRYYLEEIGLEGRVDLRSLAEIMGWKYDKKSMRVNGKVENRFYMIVPLEQLLECLTST